MVVLGVLAVWVDAHSVGQVQTTKFFAPETVQTLVSRVGGGSPGFQAGDIVSYIIQFTPVDNQGATIGAGGYVTDYIPAGTEVVGAWFVQPDGAGGYAPIAPELPGPISNGYKKGPNSYGAPFNVTSYDPSGQCEAARLAVAGTANAFAANQCNASLAQIYADTGIFYSTDSRTALFVSPDSDGRVRQGTNGYVVTPTGAGGLNTLLNQTSATTHNLWDAQQTNAFGSSSIPTIPAGRVAGNPVLITAGTVGRNATPHIAGSAVAGPDSGHPLDNTGGVGPWKRISYSGSRKGNPTGPALTTGCSYNAVPGDPKCLLASSNNATAIVGVPTSAGWNLSPASPLPTNTNAVRWAVGQLAVGTLRYVKISLRLLSSPTSGIVNNSEVFGGDSAEAAGKAGNDNPWRYHVPSVADTNSNLFLLKQVVCVYIAGVCVNSDGANVPANAKLRYRVTYLNTSNGVQTNVKLTDTLPSQTASGAVSNASIISGPNILPFAPSPTTAGGNFSFQTIPSLNSGLGGSLEYDVQTNAAVGNLVTNQVKLVSDQVTGGVTANAVSTVVNTANLSITKRVNPTEAQPGDTVTYTITVTNNGAATASGITLYDFMPTSGGSSNAATRFNYVTGSSTYAGLGTPGAVTVTTNLPPTQAPYNTDTNRQEVVWNLGSNTLAAGSSFTVTFQARVGANVPTSTTPYTNGAKATYNNGSGSTQATLAAAAPITIGWRVAGRVFEDLNYGGGVGRAFNGALGMALVANARVELYNASGGFMTSTSTDPSGNYSFSGLASGPYTVRVVNGTVASTRAGGLPCSIASSPCVGVQTYRTNASTGTVVGVDNKVGGETPALVDAAANTTNATLSSLTTASTAAQSVTGVNLGSGNISGLDFGFNFDTITSTRNAGQGSLAQFIVNANALGGEANLAQSGSRLQRNTSSLEALPAGQETSIFMIPNAALSGGVANISVSGLLPAITGSNTVLDGTTQTVNTGDTHAGQLGTGGTVGVDGLALVKVNRPEVQLSGLATLAVGVDVQAHNTTVRGLAITGFGSAPNADSDANVRIGNNFTGTLLENNVIGTGATGFTCPSAPAVSGADNVRSVGADNGILQYNLIGCAAGKGIGLEGTSMGWAITGNEVRGNAIGQSHLDGVDIENASGNATVTGNLFAQNGGVGVDSYSGAGGNIISNNTITGNGIGSTNPSNLPNETFGVRLYGTGSTVLKNLIFDNYGAGVGITSGSSANTISQNAMYGNGTVLKTGAVSAQIGIDLLSSTDVQEAGTAPFVTLNDLNDADVGGNGLLNFPVLERAVIQGPNLVLTGFARPGAILEFFIAAPDPSGFGEGQTYLFTRTEGVNDADASTGSYGFSGTCASPSTATPVNGIVQGCDTTNRFRYSVPLSSLPAGATLTAGATKLTATATLANATSEFSGLVAVFDEADLTITKTDGVTTAIPGAGLTYTITVTNTGLKTVTGATITDTLASSISSATWTCTATGTGSGCPASGTGGLNLNVNIAAGGNITFTVNATVDPGATSNLVNQASVTAPASVLDPDLGNNTATDTDTLTPRADLSLTKTASDLHAVIGSNVTFTITVSNAGPSHTQGVTVKDLLPAGLSFVSSSPSQGTYNNGSGLWTVGTLNSGSSATLTVTATVNAKPVTNTAEVTASSAADPDSTPNNATSGEDDQASVTITGANLSGTVFEDANRNGIRDPGEAGIAGVTLNLAGPSNGSATSDSNGEYTFTNLVSGAYTITETDPNGYTSTTPNTLNATVGTGNITGQDFGDFHGSRVTGTVFRDDGATANNALQEAGEPGIANITVVASTGSFTATAISDASGQYALWIPFGSGSSVTIAHATPAATGSNIGGSNVQYGSGSRIIGGFTGGQVYASINFGVVRPSLLQPDQTGQTSTPGAIAYAHQFRPGTLGTVNLGLTGTPGWGYLVFLDGDCDGSISSAERSTPVTSFTVTTGWPRETDGRLKSCALEVFVSVPANTASGTVDRATLSATLTSLNNPTIQETSRVTDTTTALLGGRLVLNKTARNCGNLTLPNDPCNGTYSGNVSGKPGDVIEYRIEYRNAGFTPIGLVVINDPVPSFTNALSYITWTKPDGSSINSPDPHLVLTALGLNVIFDLPGPVLGDVVQLRPGEFGVVLYRVRVR